LGRGPRGGSIRVNLYMLGGLNMQGF